MVFFTSNSIVFRWLRVYFASWRTPSTLLLTAWFAALFFFFWRLYSFSWLRLCHSRTFSLHNVVKLVSQFCVGSSMILYSKAISFHVGHCESGLYFSSIELLRFCRAVALRFTVAYIRFALLNCYRVFLSSCCCYLHVFRNLQQLSGTYYSYAQIMSAMLCFWHYNRPFFTVMVC